VAAIWPLSEPACPAIPGFSQSHSVLPLKTYIQETLKRSKTRFSTLQVALYYLVLLKEVIPACNYTMEQQDGNPHRIALQCGRRMFLTALMLASKYLQDRNYSAKAWSKITGLQVKEINLNEIAFLLAIDWNLHVKDSTFERWQNILIKYSNANMKAHWGHAVLQLKPSLTCPTSVLALLPTPPPSPPFLEPMVVMPAPESAPFRFPERRPSPLSQETEACYTPAVSGASRSAMSAAMSIAAFSSNQRNCKDSGNAAVQPTVELRSQSLSVDTSFTFSLNSSPPTSRETTSPTSPGSMISDHSSQSSRSSSISYASSAGSPPLQSSLLHRATKNARSRKTGPGSTSGDYNQVTVVGSSSWDDYTGFNAAVSITASPEVILETCEESQVSRKRPMHNSFDSSIATEHVRSSAFDGSEQLQHEVRTMLRTLVASDAEPKNNLLRTQFALPRLPSKRVCVDVTALEAPPMMPAFADPINYMSRPRTGPGMWTGVL
jgi:PHO85 cyclin-5